LAHRISNEDYPRGGGGDDDDDDKDEDDESFACIPGFQTISSLEFHSCKQKGLDAHLPIFQCLVKCQENLGILRVGICAVTEVEGCNVLMEPRIRQVES